VIPPKFSASIFWSELSGSQSNWCVTPRLKSHWPMRLRPTSFRYTAVPTIHQILLSSPKPNKLPKLRFVRSCSSALSPSTFHALEKAFDAPVLEAYGSRGFTHLIS
jgi:acyl-coenzyme A synthetase/AMP-(fatty) acid ligase